MVSPLSTICQLITTRPKSLNIGKIMTYDAGNPRPGLVQEQKCVLQIKNKNQI